MILFIKKILFPILIIILLLTTTLYLINNYTNKTEDSHYILKSYKNTVALYDGNQTIKIYDDIVLNTLPEQDIQYFNNGIKISTLEQVEKFLEDFE